MIRALASVRILVAMAALQLAPCRAAATEPEAAQAATRKPPGDRGAAPATRRRTRVSANNRVKATKSDTLKPEAPASEAPRSESEPGQKEGDGDDAGAGGGTLSEELRVSRQGLGLNPGVLQYGGLTLPPQGPGSKAATSKRGQFSLHGFIRVPMRIGFGSGAGLPPGYTGLKLHTPPHVPDSAYTQWQYTNQLGGPWTELLLSYGDSRVSANVMIAAYNLTDASWHDVTAQLGINEAWVTINLPEFFGPKGGFLLNIGAFNAGYGGTGRNDAGKYGTYLFGRTHTAGETVTLFYDVTNDLTLQLEHGIGVRLEAQPFTASPADPPAPPIAGQVPQLPTLLHHAHVGFTHKDKLTVAAHYLHGFTHSSTGPAEPDGHITTLGVGVKVNNSRLGSAFLGYAHMEALNAISVGGATEALHSWEGSTLAQNFWGPTAPGSGTIDSIAGEYTFSLATFLEGTDSFYGQSADLLASVFGMLNRVTSDTPNDATFVQGRTKLKVGGDVTYLPLYWLGLSARYDLVQPDVDHSGRSFGVLSSRLLFRTSFVAHEEIYVQYSRYWNGSGVVLAYPTTDTMATPDKDVVSVIANMYW